LSGLELVVGFAVVGEIADAVHGVFEEGRNGEDRAANGRTGEGPTRRSARPAALPRRLRMRRVLVGICPCRDVNGSLEGSKASSTCHTALSLRREKPES
jgi:hypothetical protein